MLDGERQIAVALPREYGWCFGGRPDLNNLQTAVGGFCLLLSVTGLLSSLLQSEPVPILARNKKRLYHLGVHEVAIELVQFV